MYVVHVHVHGQESVVDKFGKGIPWIYLLATMLTQMITGDFQGLITDAVQGRIAVLLASMSLAAFLPSFLTKEGNKQVTMS